MDPQANLKRQLELAAWITNMSDRLADLRESLVGAFDAQDYDITTTLCVEIMTHETSLEESASELAELVTELAEWRRNIVQGDRVIYNGKLYQVTKVFTKYIEPRALLAIEPRALTNAAMTVNTPLSNSNLEKV